MSFQEYDDIDEIDNNERSFAGIVAGSSCPDGAVRSEDGQRRAECSNGNEITHRHGQDI